MIEIKPIKHHYQQQILYPVEDAQEGFDYWEYEIIPSGNIAGDIPVNLQNRLAEIIDKQRWTYDKIDTITIDGVTLRVDTTLSYVEHISGDISSVLNSQDIQEKIRSGIYEYY